MQSSFIKPQRESPRRYMIPAVSALATGIVLGRALAPDLLSCLLLALCGMAAAALAWHRRWPKVCSLGALSTLLALGALNYQTRAAAPPPESLCARLSLTPGTPQLADIRALVLDSHPNSRESSPGQTLLLAAEGLHAGTEYAEVNGLLTATLWGYFSGQQPEPGDRIRIKLLLTLPGNQRNPGSPDFTEYSLARGIWVRGSGKSGLFEILPEKSISLKTCLPALRKHLAEIPLRELPAREGPLLNTILLGLRGDMSRREQLAFTRTGAGHLLAVSGIHVMLLVGGIWWLLRFLRIPPRPTAFILLGFVLAYTQLAGARTPVLRAGIMTALLLGGIILGRETNGPNSLAAAAFVIAGLWPREIFLPGFQMSFAAVLFIMTAVPALETGWQNLKRLPVQPQRPEAVKKARVAGSWLRLSLFSSLAATAATMPLVVANFGLLSPWSPLVNMLAIPVAGGALACGLLLLTVGSLLPFLTPLIAAPSWAVLQMLETTVELASRLPMASLRCNNPPEFMIIAYYVIALLLLLGPGLAVNRWRAGRAILALTLAIPVSLSGNFLARKDAQAAVTVSLLESSRGHTAVLESPEGNSGIIWVGANGRTTDSLLRAERINKPVFSLITSDKEETSAGLKELLLSNCGGEILFPCGQVTREALPSLPEATGVLEPGWNRFLGSIYISAMGAQGYKRNDGSRGSRPLSLLAESPDCSILFADFSNSYSVKETEKTLAAANKQVAILISGFCWRLPSATSRLLKIARPQIALLSMSASQRRENSGAQLIKLLRKSGTIVFTTGEYGTLRARSTPRRLRVDCWDGKNWHQLISVAKD
jgi:ComEC/Rec2-related protein